MKDFADKPRHPEKARRTLSETPRKPGWIRVSRAESPEYGQTRRILKENALSTVCEEAACPNRGECWSHRHATMMIMGETCTRGCSFCNVATGRPDALDPFEPGRRALLPVAAASGRCQAPQPRHLYQIRPDGRAWRNLRGVAAGHG